MQAEKTFDTLENEHFVLKGRLSAEQRFVEGLTQVFFGFPLTKVLFHTVLEPRNGNAPEMRTAVQYLTMPTVTAIEMANLILTTAKHSEELLLKDCNEETANNVRSILNRFQAEGSTKGFTEKEIRPKGSTKKRA